MQLLIYLDGYFFLGCSNSKYKHVNIRFYFCSSMTILVMISVTHRELSDVNRFYIYS